MTQIDERKKLLSQKEQNFYDEKVYKNIPSCSVGQKMQGHVQELNKLEVVLDLVQVNINKQVRMIKIILLVSRSYLSSY